MRHLFDEGCIVMKIFFDTEFIEDGRTIDLMSIGMVREDGTTYYAEVEECDLTRANDWVKQNVIPHLVGGEARKPRHIIRKEIIQFAVNDPEFCAYYCSYDWVSLCQLFGMMIDLPSGWPMFCRDIKQLACDKGNPRLPLQSTTEHHALNDALWTKSAYEFLTAQGLL
jgi:hypothetical protein